MPRAGLHSCSPQWPIGELFPIMRNQFQGSKTEACDGVPMSDASHPIIASGNNKCPIIIHCGGISGPNWTEEHICQRISLAFSARVQRRCHKAISHSQHDIKSLRICFKSLALAVTATAMVTSD